MQSNRIYHYTNIESLAMILSTRKLRFTRLDMVDDLLEAQTHVGINFGKFFFVSCWTTQAEESIPQWSMYSHEMRGVRIELRTQPFKQEPLRPHRQWSGIEWSGNLLSPIPSDQLWGESYFIVPMFLQNPDFFAGNVNYVPNVQEVYAQSISREVREGGAATVKVNGLPFLPRQKSSDWSFQKEYRFSLMVMPSLPLPPQGPGERQFAEMIGQHMSNGLINNVDPGIQHIDVSLAPDAFDDAIVRIGPLASAGARICVETLMARFAPKARIENSSLAGAVRPKFR